MRPGIHADSPPPSQLLHRFRIDDPELESELLAHLLTPLDLQGCRADDQDRTRAIAEYELLCDQPGLDRFAEADIVGDQEIHSRHLQRTNDRIELIVLDRDATPER